MEERDNKGRFLKGIQSWNKDKQCSIETKDKIAESNRKYTLDQNYFEKINSKEKAYFFGFMFSDGNVHREGNECSITQKKDKYILEKFQSLLKTDRPLFYIKKKEAFRLCFTSRKMKEDLIKLGCMPKKTFKVEFPTWLRENLKVHFIRGFMDGDGCIDIRSNSNSNCNKLRVRIGGRENFLKYILNLSKITGHISKREDQSIYYLKFHCSFAVSFLKWIYKDATIFLERKRNIYLKFLKEHGNYKKEINILV